MPVRTGVESCGEDWGRSVRQKAADLLILDWKDTGHYILDWKDTGHYMLDWKDTRHSIPDRKDAGH